MSKNVIFKMRGAGAPTPLSGKCFTGDSAEFCGRPTLLRTGDAINEHLAHIAINSTLNICITTAMLGRINPTLTRNTHRSSGVPVDVD